MPKKDYYQILGVPKNASDQEIKQAYRRLARKYHPDVNPGDKASEEYFKTVNEAYEVLSDKEKRTKYDQYGEQWQYADRFAQAGYRQAPQQPFGEPGQGAFHFEEGEMSGIFEQLFGSRMGGRRARPRRGQDIEYAIEITLEEAYHGATRVVALQSEETCPVCHGTGRVANAMCANCRGAGVVPQVRRFEVKIPQGVTDGSRIRMAGMGEPGFGGGPNGDLYIVTSIRPSEQFERKGDDLYTDVKVPLTVAALGGEVEVPTLKGKVALKIPAETQNGRIFRLTGQGMPHLNDSVRGDLFARVDVVLPTNLSSEEKDLFKHLGKLRPAG